MDSEDLSDYCGNGSKCRDPSSLSTTRHRSQVLAAAKASMSFNVHSNQKCAQCTIHSVKRPQVQQKGAYYAKHVHTRFTYTALICTRVTCAILFEVAQVQADLMLGRGSKVGGLGAGGLRGITPTNHLRMHTGEKSNKCEQCDCASSQAF